ncbi:ABC transporter substrate-binding protein [Gordonia humi]|uniref:Polar amino acid transport system substrate-binding protein n=1 Tax=Gordonia humi TaxID=686429 RepID=A0A840ERC8_9ACTN|nr:ABC transporter substrate-binding protein [Gordonia humi]MBB4135395.1 polar amino acid transport system substrate-binding protein [Gordonia humi]
MRIRLPSAVIAVCAVLVLGTAACSSDDESDSASSATSIPVDELNAHLPSTIRDSHTLRVVTHTPFAPMEFWRDGRLVGFDVDVMTRVAKLLGVGVDLRDVSFPDLLPSVVGGSSDVAVAGLSDTAAREEQVDMVTYLRAGTLWARKTGADIGPHDACGRRVGAQTGTVQLTVELPAKSQACETTGEKPLEIVGFASEIEAIDALKRGDVDAVSADSPVSAYAVETSHGELETTGGAFDTRPYGFAVSQRSELGPVLREAVQHLIDSGELKEIAGRWGLERGVINKSVVNSAIK